MSDVTRLLDAAAAGDPQAAADLLPLVYDELRKLAAARLAAERPGPDPPGHRPGPRGVPPAGRADGSRTGTAAGTSSPPPPRPCAASSSTAPAGKRPGQARRRTGGGSTSTTAAAPPADGPADDLLALDEALDPAGRRGPRPAELVKLRYFAGLTARARRPPPSASRRPTADRHWAYARAWLHGQLAGD